MPAPATVTELLDLVQKSGVADENRLKPYLEKFRQKGGLPAEPKLFAGLLVRDGLLTYFQAEQLLQGKFKRFSLGKYKVLEKLGSGGMGTVYLCEHKLMRRRVAVKVLPTAKAADEASLKRFYREAQAVAAVDHPNIVRAYDLDQDESLHFLVMEYVDGTNLQDLIKKNGPLDIVRACHYIYGSAVGLQHASEIGLVHRDIKPGNILLDRSGVVKILDLGLARFFHDADDNITRQYDETILGTADYLSPEQADDSHTVDIRTDIYSLGATFYFLLTGSPPFPEGTIPQKLIWVRSRQPKAIREIRPDVPEDVVAVVAKMMAKNPAERYQTPAEVIAALTAWASMPIAPPSEREMPQLSPAITGGQGGIRPGAGGSPRSMSSPVPMHGLNQSGIPTLISSGNTPSPLRNADSGADGVWESLADVPLDSEPDDLPGGSTVTPSPKSARYRPASAEKKSRRTILLLASLVGLILAGTGAGIYFAFFNKKSVVVTPVEKNHRIMVSRAQAQAGVEHTVATLREALQKSSSGDTIVVVESPLSEPFTRIPPRTKDITIESGLPDGKPVVIEFVSSGGASYPMLEFSGCNNVHFKNFELDGKGVAEYGILINGVAPGVTIENVTVRNVKVAAFNLANVAGQKDRPAVLDHVRAILTQSNEAGAIIAVPPGATLESKYIAIRGNRFEGPGKAGIVFKGAASDFEVTENRFYRLDAAIVLSRVSEGRPFKGSVTQNTIYESKIGLQFAGAGNGPMNVTVSRNYFVKTAAVVDGPGVVGVSASENGQRESGPGNGPVPAPPIDSPQLPPPNPESDAAFLRFPTGTGPMIGVARIGAN